jgi:hypothetical protein
MGEGLRQPDYMTFALLAIRREQNIWMQAASFCLQVELTVI